MFVLVERGLPNRIRLSIAINASQKTGTNNSKYEPSKRRLKGNCSSIKLNNTHQSYHHPAVLCHCPGLAALPELIVIDEFKGNTARKNTRSLSQIRTFFQTTVGKTLSGTICASMTQRWKRSSWSWVRPLRLWFNRFWIDPSTWRITFTLCGRWIGRWVECVYVIKLDGMNNYEEV